MSKPIRVLFLTQYFPPETGAPQVRLFEMAKWLARRGFEIEVLTSLPNYPQGRIYDDYRGKLYSVESRDDMRIIRAPIYPNRKAGLLRRLANYFSFVFSSMLFGLLLARRPDVIICESPPLFLGISALFLKAVKWCRLIFNVSDLFPESAVRMQMYDRKPFIWMARKLERLCYRGSDAVTGQSPGIVRGVRENLSRGVVEMIPNGCDCELFHPRNRDEDFRRRYGLDGKVVVGYAGLVGLPQGIGVIVEAADRLRNDDRIRFVIAGDGPERERIESELKTRRLPNVVFTGWLAKEAMPRTVASFDIAFVSLRYYLPGALPSKVYESMASQIPIVLAAQGDARELVERADAGVVAPYDEIDKIVEAIRLLADRPSERTRMGCNGRQYVLKYHQRTAIAAKLGDVIEAVAGNNSSHRKAA